jgi:hypothetical protein
MHRDHRAHALIAGLPGPAPHASHGPAVMIAEQAVRSAVVGPWRGHELRPDPLEGHLAAGAGLHFDIPWKIANLVQKHGLAQHLPLTYLTDKAVRQSSLAGDSDEVIGLDRDSLTLRASAKPLSSVGEEELEYGEWKQGFKRFLIILEKYFPHLHEKWARHMLRIEDTPDALSENWKLWLLYDIEVRTRATFIPLDPSVFQVNIFEKVRSSWLLKKVSLEARTEARTAATAAMVSAAFSKQSLKSSTGAPPTSTTTRKGTATSSFCSLCLCCGRSVHRTDECTDSTRIDGGSLYITNKAMAPGKAYRDPEGKPVCLRWNVRSTCRLRVSKACAYRHVCTLDGKDHRTIECPLIGSGSGTNA